MDQYVKWIQRWISETSTETYADARRLVRDNPVLALLAAFSAGCGALSLLVPGLFWLGLVIMVPLLLTKEWPFAAFPVIAFGAVCVIAFLVQSIPVGGFWPPKEFRPPHPYLFLMVVADLAVARQSLNVLFGAVAVIMTTVVFLAAAGLVRMFPGVAPNVLLVVTAVIVLMVCWKNQKALRKLNGEEGRKAAKAQVQKIKDTLRSERPAIALAVIGLLAVFFEGMVSQPALERLKELDLFGGAFYPAYPADGIYGLLLLAAGGILFRWMPRTTAAAAPADVEPEELDPKVAVVFNWIYALDKRERAFRLDWRGFLTKTLRKLKVTPDQLDDLGITLGWYSEYADQRAAKEIRESGVADVDGTVDPAQVEILGFRHDFLHDHGTTPEKILEAN